MSFMLTYGTQKLKSKKNSTTSQLTKSSSNYHGKNDSATNFHNSIIQLQRTIGNQALQRIKHLDTGSDYAKPDMIQPTLKLSHPGDAFEREADRVAEEVMSSSKMPTYSSHSMNAEANNIIVSKEELESKYPACETKKDNENDKPEVNRKPLTTAMSNLKSPNNNETENGIHNILHDGSRGSSLDRSTKIFMESRFGYNFSNVRIHTSEKAASSARSMNALAYTIGNNIVFGQGQYQPNTHSGQKLLAHELTHVVQQHQQSDTVNNKRVNRLDISKMSLTELTINRKEDPKVSLTQELETQFRQAISASNWNYAVDRLAANNMTEVPKLLERYVTSLMALQNLKNAAIKKFGTENRIVAVIESLIESKFHIQKVTEVKK
jgi:uncharacterized protein DUF4157